jgi:predicted glycoside hydrolase/deacetylase ChbG (UPF0249 family)
MEWRGKGEYIMDFEQVGPVLARLAKEATVVSLRDPERKRRVCQLTEELDQIFQKEKSKK